ncbi:MAG: nucleotidyltransferase domain-containing protein [Bacillota bacterium]|nr:nucleotidyltransferase domain-containing protein [Bacillota bacterium]
MDEVLDAVVQRIVKTVNPDRIILFGSRRTGGGKPESDYDLLVLKGGISNRRALAHQLYRTLIDVPAAVDVLVETPERVERHRHTPGLVYEEAARGLVVYER